MLLFLMRHGIAEPLSNRGDDASRPLSVEGHQRTAQVVQGLQQLLPTLGVLASSPKLRARQTAQLVYDGLATAPPLQIWDELGIESGFEPLLGHLKRCQVDSVLLVGHEPNLSRFVSWLLTGDEEKAQIEFKKAGVCALELEWHGNDLSATLLWIAPPKVLRKIAV